MPRRPRQHQLEELSRRAFRARLPEAWVVRDLNPDYGLDVAVDIFENELATGLSFAVQLKATENDDLRRALSGIRFTVDMAAFYRAYEVPVLVALFHVPTDRLFAKWFHAFDPHYSTSAVHGSRPARTFSFRLLETDEWVDDTPARLVAEVKGFRRFRSPELDLPVRFHLMLAEQEVHGATVVEHAFALRQAASGIADLVRITTEGQVAGEPTILLTQEKTVVALGGVASTTVHHEQRLEDSDREAIVHNTLLALGLAFEQIGQVNLAAQVASEVAAASPLIADPDVAFRVAGFMFRSRRILEALRLADALDQSEDEEIRIASFVLLSPTLARGDDLSEEEWRETERVLRRRAERRERAGNLRDAASEYYNLGNHFKTSRRGREAFKNYHRAIRLRPDYLERDYFNGEIAGVLFELGHHQLAAHYYRRAIELGSSGMAHALYADALLWSGRYREADEALAEYLADDPNGHAEWRLKRLLLSHLRQVIGDTQQRRPEAAESLAELRDDDTPETARARLERALASDALCGEAWVLLAVLAAADPDIAFPLALTGALLHRHSPSAWRNAIILCWMSESHRPQLKDVAGAGYFLNGQALLDEVIDYARGQGEELDKREFLRVVEEAVGSVQEEQRGFEIRVLGEGNEYVSLRFDPLEPNPQG